MTIKLTTLALATTMSFAAMAPSSFAMTSELNALTGAVYNGLNGMQMDLADIDDLTLAEIQQIDQVMSGGDTESEKRNKINTILRRAGER